MHIDPERPLFAISLVVRGRSSPSVLTDPGWLHHTITHNAGLTADEKWASAIATTMIERGTITQPELDEAMGISTEEPPVL